MHVEDHGPVLVRGAGSGVGASIARYLAESGTSVIANFRTLTPLAASLDGLNRVTLLQGDLLDLSSLSLVPTGIGAVVHCAATLESLDVSDLIDGNILATRELLRQVDFGRCRTWIQLSTASVHGEVIGGRLDRYTGFVDPSCYGSTKRLAEQLLEQATDLESIHCLRLPSVLTPGARNHWLARVSASAGRGEPIIVDNPGLLFNNTIHIEDLCRFVTSLLRGGATGYDAYPLASSCPVPSIEVVSKIIKDAGSTSAVVNGVDRERSFFIDDSYARKAYGYTSRATLTAVEHFVRQLKSPLHSLEQVE